MKKIGVHWLAVFFIVSYCSINKSITLLDASHKLDELTDSTPLKTTASLLSGKKMIIGMCAEGMQENSLILVNENNYHGIVAKTLMVNYEADKSNPLYDQKISLLAVPPLGSNPIVVLEKEPKNLYVMQNYQNKTTNNIIPFEKVKDSAGEETGGILAITAAPSQWIFASVLGNNSTQFGDVGSGVAILLLSEFDSENKSRRSKLMQLDALKEDPVPKENSDEKTKSNETTKEEDRPERIARAAEITRSLPALKINNDLSHIGNIIDMVWDYSLQVLYVALQVKGSDDVNSGARAILVGKRIGTEKFIFQPLAPDTIFTQGKQNEIIGAIAPNAAISIHKVRPMRNSAELPYLIVLGGNGLPEDTKRSIYALPIYTGTEEDKLGHLAKIDSAVINGIYSVQLPIFTKRFFDKVATNPEDIFTTDDKVALVGGASLKEGDIDDIIVCKDLVIATVKSASDGSKPGIFCSRALLNEVGIIIGWTPWQRMAGITDAVLGATFDQTDGSIIFAYNNNVDGKLTIKKTTWSNNEQESSLEKKINEIFKNSGITNMYDFPAAIKIGRGSLFGIVGSNKIALLKTGLVQNDTLIPITDEIFNKNPKIYKNNSIAVKPEIDDALIVFDNSVLSQIAPLTAIDFVNNGKQEWMMVGGGKGLIILTHDDGHGCLLDHETSDPFSKFEQGMVFKKINGYRFVHKITNDRNYAYVLTENSLERIDLCNSNFATGKIVSSTLATTNKLAKNGAFFDVIVSEKLILLATSNGLFRLGNNKDSILIKSEEDADWRSINLPEAMNAITQLEAHSITGKPEDISRESGGMVYVLGSCRGKNKSRIHRIAIKSTQGENQIDDTTVLVAKEHFIGKDNASHATLNTFRKKIITDGALLLSFPTSNTKKFGLISGGKSRGKVNDIIPIPSTGEIKALVRESASGRWLIGGTFGLLIHE